MKKNLSAAAVLFLSAVMYSQVGINNTDPKATLDIIKGTGTVGAIKIVDGTQGARKVLVSDANGVGVWKNVASLHQVQEATPTDTTLDPSPSPVPPSTTPPPSEYSIPGIGTYTCQNTGKYELITHTFFKVAGSGAADQRSFYVQVLKTEPPIPPATTSTPSVIKEEEVYFYAAGGGWLTTHMPIVVSANANDKLEIKIKPSVGGILQIESGTANRNKLDVFYLGE